MQANENEVLANLRVAYYFEPSGDEDAQSFDIKHYADELPLIAGNVPRYWSVDEKDREFLRSFHSSPKFYGQHLVSFGLDLPVDDAERIRLEELLNEVVNTKSDTVWLLNSGRLVCRAGFSGEAQAVKAEIIERFDLGGSDRIVPKPISSPKG